MNCNISWPLQHPAPKVFVHSPRMSDVAATGKRSQMLSGPGPIQFQHLSTGLPKSDCTWLWHPGIPSNLGGGEAFRHQNLRHFKRGMLETTADSFMICSLLGVDGVPTNLTFLYYPIHLDKPLPALLQLGHHLQVQFLQGRCDVAFRLQEDIGRFQRRM